jgi:hypothetical protein
MSKDKAILYTQKILTDLQKLEPVPHAIEIDSILGYVRILYSTLKEMEVDLSDAVPAVQDTIPTVTQDEFKEEITGKDNNPENTSQPAENEIVPKEVATSDQESVDDSNNVTNTDTHSEPNDLTPVEEAFEEKSIAENESWDQVKAEGVKALETLDILVNTGETGVSDKSDDPSLESKVDDIPLIEPQIEDEGLHSESKSTLIQASKVDSVISPAIEDLFRDKGPTGLVDFLGLSSIDDIRKAWGLNDKMLIIKELFNNDGAVFEDALSMLNKFTSFAEAKSFLCNQIIPRYDWNDVAKFKRASNFIMNVKRLYI